MPKRSTISTAEEDAGVAPLLANPRGPQASGEMQRVQVDSQAAEQVIGEKRIGERIRHLRLKRSMGLVELGRHTGLSASFLSQLETGRVVPTLRNLARIAMVFSKDLSYFFDPEPQTLFRVHRQRDRVRLPQSGVEEPSYYFASLGYLVPDRQLDPYFAEFLPPKEGREPRAHQHIGHEFLYVLSGKLAVRHGQAIYDLEPGDAVYFDANTIHSYVCAGDVPANAVIVTLQSPGNPSHGLRGQGVARVRGLHPVSPAPEFRVTAPGLGPGDTGAAASRGAVGKRGSLRTR
jgi:transcriptional regulator with XRE-family HTH domain